MPYFRLSFHYFSIRHFHIDMLSRFDAYHFRRHAMPLIATA
jgi:hypothetical protein